MGTQTKYLKAGRNSQSGTAVFNKTKQVTVTFPHAFAFVPVCMLTLNDLSNDIPYKLTATTTELTIRLKTNFTGSIDWQATARQ